MSTIDILNKAFGEVELFYAPITEQLLETFKRTGYGVLVLKSDEDYTEVAIKQLSWNMSSSESLECVKSVFKTFEFELEFSADDFCEYVYCVRISEDIYKIIFTQKKLEFDMWSDNIIWTSD